MGPTNALGRRANRGQGSVANPSTLVERIDHIMMIVATQQEVRDLQSIFRDTLGLPEWFPPGVRVAVNRPTWRFYNTGVYMGNVFVEFITFNTDSSTSQPEFPRRTGLAFESATDSVENELDLRGIRRGNAERFMMVNRAGHEDTLFTNVSVRDLTSRSMTVFFCHYHPELLKSPAFDFGRLSSVGAFHSYFESVVKARSGGGLGIVEVKEVVVSAPTDSGHRAVYESLLAPAKPSDRDVWKPPLGPAIRLIPGEGHEIRQLVVRVSSASHAIDQLKKRGLLGAVTTDSAQLSPGLPNGVQVLFVER